VCLEPNSYPEFDVRQAGHLLIEARADNRLRDVVAAINEHNPCDPVETVERFGEIEKLDEGATIASLHLAVGDELLLRGEAYWLVEVSDIRKQVVKDVQAFPQVDVSIYCADQVAEAVEKEFMDKEKEFMDKEKEFMDKEKEFMDEEEEENEEEENIDAYYHITAVENLESIMREGLKGGTKPRNRPTAVPAPSTFVLISKDAGLTEQVALTQIWVGEDVGEYAILRIDPAGVTGPVLPDLVGEFTAPWHRIIQQDVIQPRYLELVERRRVDYPGGRIFEVLIKVGREKFGPADWEIATKYLAEDYHWMQRDYEAGLWGQSAKEQIDNLTAETEDRAGEEPGPGDTADRENEE
jgi:hypothetical protein